MTSGLTLADRVDSEEADGCIVSAMGLRGRQVWALSRFGVLLEGRVGIKRENLPAVESRSAGSRSAWRMVPLAFALAVALGLLVTSLASAPTAQAHGPVDQSSPGFPASNGAGAFDDFHSGNRFQEFTPSMSPLIGVDLVVGNFNPALAPPISRSRSARAAPMAPSSAKPR